MKLRLYLALAALAVGLTAAPLSASPATPVREVVKDWAISKNMRALGFSENVVPLSGPGSNVVNSDLAFQGDWAFQGTYDGFVIHDVRVPSRPKIVLNYEECATTAGSRTMVNDITFLEGHSNQGHALCYEPVGAPPAYC